MSRGGTCVVIPALENPLLLGRPWSFRVGGGHDEHHSC